MKPCDCKDERMMKQLNETGLFFCGNGITINPNFVILQMDNTTIKIPMRRFEQFAKWYLTDQMNDETRKIFSD